MPSLLGLHPGRAWTVALLVGCIGVILQYYRPELLKITFGRFITAKQRFYAEPSAAYCALELEPYVCAHGGDTTTNPPNTAAAFAAAISAGVDCIELDMSLTADGQLVASHSRDLTQLLGRPDAKVAEYTLQELLSTRWPTGEAVLTAEQALTAVAPHVDLVILDVKFSNPDRVINGPTGVAVSEEALLSHLVLQLLATIGHNNTLVWGKSDAFVQRIKQSAPGQLAGYSVMFDQEGSAPHFEDALRVNMQGMEVAAVYHGMLDHCLMERLTAANKSVFVWSVDEPGDMRRMLDLGVHGIVTNRPKQMLDAVEKQQQQCRKR